jgi:hypothetical protein
MSDIRQMSVATERLVDVISVVTMATQFLSIVEFMRCHGNAFNKLLRWLVTTEMPSPSRCIATDA